MKSKIFITLLLLTIVAPVIFLAMTIKNSKDCSQIVIDSYELHSGIDIPHVQPVNCYFDSIINVRVSVYSFEGLVNIEKYLSENNFDPIELKDVTLPMIINNREKPSSPTLYVASGKRWGRKWRYIFEKESNRLWAELKYD